MRPRRKRRLRFVEAMQLDTLVDLVSNNVGVLVILTAFVALVSVLNPLEQGTLHQAPAKASGGAQSPEASRSPATPMIQTLAVPWAHSSQKNPVFAALIGGRVKLLDLSPLYEELLHRPQPTSVRPLDVHRPGVVTRFYPITNDVYCFQFRVAQNAGEPLTEARKPGSAWTQER